MVCMFSSTIFVRTRIFTFTDLKAFLITCFEDYWALLPAWNAPATFHTRAAPTEDIKPGTVTIASRREVSPEASPYIVAEMPLRDNSPRKRSPYRRRRRSPSKSPPARHGRSRERDRTRRRPSHEMSRSRGNSRRRGGSRGTSRGDTRRRQSPHRTQSPSKSLKTRGRGHSRESNKSTSRSVRPSDHPSWGYDSRQRERYNAPHQRPIGWSSVKKVFFHFVWFFYKPKRFFFQAPLCLTTHTNATYPIFFLRCLEQLCQKFTTVTKLEDLTGNLTLQALHFIVKIK